MAKYSFPASLAGLKVHLVGAKGTGMAALAEILAAKGASLSGSDVADVFYTDAILARIGLDLRIDFSATNLPPGLDLVIHSAAYARDRNPELIEAERRGIRILSYPEALGSLSQGYDSSGIAGVHGKTTTTAMAGSIMAALQLPATILAGSAVASFGGNSTSIKGDRYFVAETCEYRRHFLSFHPRRIILTSVESDHQDFFPTYESIRKAFVDYALLLPQRGELIYCADDEGAREVVEEVSAARRDIRLVPYGFEAPGDWHILSYEAGEGQAAFRLEGFPSTPFPLRVPGRHLALDATAALALAASLFRDFAPGKPLSQAMDSAARALGSFSGSKRRSEILGEAGGVLFMDDYGHHPTAIRETLRGIRDFWPSRRLIVDFMSHTASRTRALFEDFASSLDEADLAILHRIYPSAREAPDPGMTGRLLFEAAKASRETARAGALTLYFDDVLEGRAEILGILRPGDLFLTMGAGDNWRLGAALLADLSSRSRDVS